MAVLIQNPGQSVMAVLIQAHLRQNRAIQKFAVRNINWRLEFPSVCCLWLLANNSPQTTQSVLMQVLPPGLSTLVTRRLNISRGALFLRENATSTFLTSFGARTFFCPFWNLLFLDQFIYILTTYPASFPHIIGQTHRIIVNDDINVEKVPSPFTK